MRRYPITLIFDWARLRCGPSPRPGQAPAASCEWRGRGDRFEGVIRESTPVSAGNFEPVSVSYRGRRDAGAASAPLSLYFWQPAGQARSRKARVWKKAAVAVERQGELPDGARK